MRTKLGQAESIRVDTVNPNCNWDEININKLTLLVSPNGAGKSFINVLIWCFATIMQVYVKLGCKINDELMKYANYVVSHSISSEELTGTVSVKFEAAKVTMEFLNREVISFEVESDREIAEATPAQYLSATTRLMSSLVAYLKLRQHMALEELSGMYKLYDILFWEGQLARMPITLSESAREQLKKFNIAPIQKVYIDGVEIMCELENGKLMNVCTFSAGEQSVITMITSNM